MKEKMQNFNKVIESLKTEEFFKQFKNFKLVNIFGILKTNELIWQFNYQNPKNNKLITVTPSTKSISEEQNTLNKNKKIEELKIEDVKTEISEALKLIGENIKENKVIISLHTKNKETFWNFTILTNTLQILNIKVNAKTKVLISKKETPILDFKKT